MAGVAAVLAVDLESIYVLEEEVVDMDGRLNSETGYC
jgi:hypothetical protein